MATIIVTQTADKAYYMQDLFRAANRDCYPLGVYAAIFECITVDVLDETYDIVDDLYGFDVIGWCSCINKTTLDDLSDLDMLADLATVLYVDYDTKTVYYLPY